MTNVKDIRADFPILDCDYVYFDNAATSQRPVQVMDAITKFYKESNANPLRGLYDWSVDATEKYENARHTVAGFIGAEKDSEIIFTRNTTESINLVAYTYGLDNISEGDEIVISVMEHHSNILPWQMVAAKKGAKLIYMEPLEDGTITEEEYKSKITDKTKLVAIGHVSNVMGITNPVKEIAEYAHSKGSVVLVDGAQSAPHMKVDVKDLDADFFAFSGHKLLGPMGIGALYVKNSIMEKMNPFLRGGEMIEYVTRQDATYAELPHKFEAGTVNAAGAVGLEAAINYIENLGFDFIMEREEKLTKMLMEEMKKMPYIKIYGSDDSSKHCGIVTFTMDGVHPHDVSSVLNEDHVCIRAGHHCAQPLMQFIGAGSTVRASLYFYNTEEEVGVFLDKLKGVRKVMGYGA
ncbi:MAG: SufS family cysteine desulfurase [Butyrivibrio sp.]|nr:SufS family cysteine desulfurase [Butyrivibrio sp.]